MSDQQTTRRPRWQYYVSKVSTDGPGDLNSAQRTATLFGDDGWELVSATSDRYGTTTQLWFKRQVA